MSKSEITIAVKEETKEKFNEFCYSKGLSMEDAIGTFIRKTVSKGSFPFKIRDKSYKRDKDKVLKKDMANKYSSLVNVFDAIDKL